jgi:hypothetical protein
LITATHVNIQSNNQFYLNGGVVFGESAGTANPVGYVRAKSLEAITGLFTKARVTTDLVVGTTGMVANQLVTSDLRVNGEIAAVGYTSGSLYIWGQGITGSAGVTGLCEWRMANKIVTLHIPQLQGWAIDTEFRIAGIPTYLRPANHGGDSAVVPISIRDGTAYDWGNVMFFYDGTFPVCKDFASSSDEWTPNTYIGMSSATTLTYHLD